MWPKFFSSRPGLSLLATSAGQNCVEEVRNFQDYPSVAKHPLIETEASPVSSFCSKGANCCSAWFPWLLFLWNSWSLVGTLLPSLIQYASEVYGPWGYADSLIQDSLQGFLQVAMEIAEAFAFQGTSSTSPMYGQCNLGRVHSQVHEHALEHAPKQIVKLSERVNAIFQNQCPQATIP
jgi:hypothetical protein